MTDIPSLDAPAPPSRMARIKVLSAVMVWSCTIIAVLLPTGVATIWLAAPTDYLAAQAKVPIEWLGDFQWFGRGAGMAVTLVPLAALVWALLRVRVCFAGFARGELFTGATTAGFRDFSLGVLLWAVLSVPAATALSVLMSWGAPPGQRQLAIAVSSDTLLMLFFAGTTAVVGWILAEASAIAEENAQFV